MIEKKINRHFRRFEFKYFLEKSLSDFLIPELMNYMEWDPYIGDKDYYECHSLYLDNKNLKCYHEKIDGLLNRKKVRIRTYKKNYGNEDNLFFELKRKSGEIVLKDREIIPGKFLDIFLENPFSLLKEKTFDQEFLNEFIFETVNYQLKPKCLVSYKRKPFFAKNNPGFRVTFDYNLEFATASGSNYNQVFTPMHEEFIIIEVKFNGTLPHWFHSIIENYRLKQTTSCKYCFGLDTLSTQSKFVF